MAEETGLQSYGWHHLALCGKFFYSGLRERHGDKNKDPCVYRISGTKRNSQDMTWKWGEGIEVQRDEQSDYRAFG